LRNFSGEGRRESEEHLHNLGDIKMFRWENEKQKKSPIGFG